MTEVHPGQGSGLDVLTMGRVGVDLYPDQVGLRLPEVETFGKYLGGSPTNVAVAAARHGRRTAVITRTGADPFGEFVRTALRGYGVQDRFVGTDPKLATPLTFCEIFPPDHFPLYFYREPTAPDLCLTPDELDYSAIAAARLFWVTVTGLSAEPSRAATLAALRHRTRHAPAGAVTVLDLDYRPMFWTSREEARKWIAEALPHVTVAVGNLDECATAVGTDEPTAAAHQLLNHGVGTAIVKQGGDGVLALTAAAQGSPDGVGVHVPPVPVDVVNGLGAGDGFGGALAHGILADWSLRDTVVFANAAGAIVASRLSCSEAMPTTAEVHALLDNRDG